jgi:hypothetical protein
MKNKYSLKSSFPHTTLQAFQRLANLSALVVRRRESSLIEQEWLKLARQRLEDIDANKVEMIPLEIVLNRIDRLLSK